MQEGEIYPRYEIICEDEKFKIFGKEISTGETVMIEYLSDDLKAVSDIVDVLNDFKVSIYHSEDVIRDMLIAPLFIKRHGRAE